MAVNNQRVSDDTNAILDRLKREGELLRNRGAHSVKSVKIELGKFDGVFDTIALNITEQTDMMRETLGIQQDAARAQERAAELAELKTRSTPLLPDVDQPEATTRDGGVLALLGQGLFGTLKTLGGLFLKGAIGVAAGAALWQVAKGFIDQKLGSGAADSWLDSVITSIKNFKDEVIQRAPTVVGEALDVVRDYTDLAREKLPDLEDALGVIGAINETYEETKERITGENGILQKTETAIDNVKTTIDEVRADVPGMVRTAKDAISETSATLGNINGMFEGVNFGTLGATFTRLSNELPPAANKILDFFQNPLTSILPAVTAGLVTGGVAKMTGSAIAGLIPGRNGGKIDAVGNLRTAAIGAVGLGIAIFGDRVKGWLNNTGLADVDVGGVNVASFLGGALDVVGMAAQGATLGAFFGPGGALFGAVVGGVIGLGLKLWDWFTNSNDEAEDLAEQEMEAANARKTGRNKIRPSRPNVTPVPEIDPTTQPGYDPAAAFQEQRDALVDEYVRLSGNPDNRGNRRNLQKTRAAIRTLEENATSQGLNFVNFAPNTTYDNSVKTGATTVVESRNTNLSTTDGGGNAGSPFAASVQ